MTMNRRCGQLSLQVLLFSSLAVIMLAGFVLWADTNLRAAYRILNGEQAFMIAEAGVDYYRWHLAHDQDDYYDGRGASSSQPYIHPFFDKAGNRLGQFELTITPPPSGSTVVTIVSVGKTDADPSITRRITVKMAIPSFAKYAAVMNGTMRFGEGTAVYGPIHSNGGIRFDGVAYNLISSALFSYDDPDHSGGNEFAVHTHVAPSDPLPTSTNSPLPSRTDVFTVGRQVEAPTVDFVGITQDLATIESTTKAIGFYLPSSTKAGYEIVLNANDTFGVYRVNTTTSASALCRTGSGGATGWALWSFTSSTFLGTYPNPTSGLIFVSDNVWVRGQIDTARLTIVAGLLPDNPARRKNITFNQDVRYTHYDGQDALSFIAQQDVNIGFKSNNVIRVDGAMIAQNGRVGRHYYASACGAERIRQEITTYGMLGSNQRYGFAYTDGTGYQVRNLIYDNNLLYAPPPSFPLTSDQYEQISWEED